MCECVRMLRILIILILTNIFMIPSDISKDYSTLHTFTLMKLPDGNSHAAAESLMRVSENLLKN